MKIAIKPSRAGRVSVRSPSLNLNLQFSILNSRLWLLPAAIAFVAWLAVIVAIDPAGEFPRAWQGPGLTLDEPFNVMEGAWLADELFRGDLEGYAEATGLLPDHPPLGRVWLGVWHDLLGPLFKHIPGESPLSIGRARVASASAFAALVFAVGLFAGRWYGAWGGAVASVSLVLMPRTFGHAHIASLESSINFTYGLAVLTLAHRWGDAALAFPPSNKPARTGPTLDPLPTRETVYSGIWFGLALLTKMQAVFLPVPVAVWALCLFRRRAIKPLLIWGAVGAAVFFMGWPWLWSHPFDHLREYFGRATQRASISVWYFGQAIADRDVPWHYPWVIFLTTVPLGLQLTGVWGVFGGDRPAWKSRRDTLLLACIGFPLLLFSIPDVAVYDGERLFSVVYPLWAVLVGRGAECALRRIATRVKFTRARWLLAGFIAVQAYGVIAFAPCYLSYYNLLTGGLTGADRLGLQVTYWGDSITRELLQQAVEEIGPSSPPRDQDSSSATAQPLRHVVVLPYALDAPNTRTYSENQVIGSADVFFTPVLHQFQLDTMYEQSPILRKLQFRLQPYTGPPTKDGSRRTFILLFRRKEYLPEELREAPPHARLVAEVRRQGVLLAALYELLPP